jgi:metacaspase-1
MAKRALLVAINQYSIASENLNGCVNDAVSLRQFLMEKRGFDNASIKMLTDSDATSENIKSSLSSFVNDASTGDQLVFGFSGHGVQKGFNVGNEIDGKNEAIVPHDISYNSLITDNELNQIITQKVQDPGIKFSAIYDCCHSGTMIRSISFNSATEEPDIIKNRCVMNFDLRDINWGTRDAMAGPYNVLSACKDSETAADLKVNGVYRGAFSFALHNLLNEAPDTPIGDLETSVLQKIKSVSSHTQHPTYYAVDPTLPAI